MKIKSLKLITELIENTNINLSKVEVFKTLPIVELNKKQNSEKWSILECIEHLNLYGDFYLPVLKNCINKNKTKSSVDYKSGFVGNYFVNSMIPKKNLNKMKTSKDKNPLGSSLNKNILDRFITQQKELIALLEKSKQVDLARTKTSISISKLIKLRLGDTLRFIIAHNNRHLLQAEKTLS